jgi:predicted dehydrogenase
MPFATIIKSPCFSAIIQAKIAPRLYSNFNRMQFMSQRKLNWAILGTSYISGVLHEAIEASDTGTSYALLSRTAESGKEFAKKFPVKKIYHDYNALLQDPDIDAVYIALPNHLHKDYTLKAIAAGKHVLCEKPFVMTAAEANEVITALKNSNVVCMEALMYRHHPQTLKLKEFVESGVLGEIKYCNAVYAANIADIANRTAGGSIRNLGCYPVSLIRYLLDAEPDSILAAGRVNTAINTDNQAVAIMQFGGNILATVTSVDDMEMYWQFELHGTKGILKMISNPWLPEQTGNRFVVHTHDSGPVEICIDADKPLYTYQIEVMAQKIYKKQSLSDISLQDTYGNAVVLEVWLQQLANRTGAIKIPELMY